MIVNWLKFLHYINGVSYVFEGYLVNEFTYSIPCSSSQIVPFNEARDTAYQTCAVAGSKPGSLFVEGSNYLSVSFGYSHTHLWRNVGVVIAFSVLYIIPTIIASELLPFAGEGGGSTIFARTKRAKRAIRQSETRKDDLEANAVHRTTGADQLDRVSTHSASERTTRTAGSQDEKKTPPDLEHKPIFTWKDLNYTIDGHHLLNNISGYVKPGEMTVRILGSNIWHPLMTSFCRR
jgi:ATP-binding cassette, subfamily G (WHITE), member 2, SNQ2